jgi:hypothetical protein
MQLTGPLSHQFLPCHWLGLWLLPACPVPSETCACQKLGCRESQLCPLMYYIANGSSQKILGPVSISLSLIPQPAISKACQCHLMSYPKCILFPSLLCLHHLLTGQPKQAPLSLCLQTTSVIHSIYTKGTRNRTPSACGSPS